MLITTRVPACCGLRRSRFKLGIKTGTCYKNIYCLVIWIRTWRVSKENIIHVHVCHSIQQLHTAQTRKRKVKLHFSFPSSIALLIIHTMLLHQYQVYPHKCLTSPHYISNQTAGYVTWQWRTTTKCFETMEIRPCFTSRNCIYIDNHPREMSQVPINY